MPGDSAQDLDMRRDYRPRRNTHTQLLRTCQRVYSETWHMPFFLTEHIFYVGPRNVGTNEDIQRDETKFIKHARLTAYLRVPKDYLNDHPTFRIPRIDRVKYYVQPRSSNPACNINYWNKRHARGLGPKCVTLSLSYKNSQTRYADGYNLKAKWVNETRFPNSITRICMELGKFSDEAEVREIVSEVISKWFFRRRDGVIFRTAEDNVVCRRWVAHEPPRNQFSWTRKVYIIPMVTWKPVNDFDPFADGHECPDLNLTGLAKRSGRRPLGDITRDINRVTAH